MSRLIPVVLWLAVGCGGTSLTAQPLETSPGTEEPATDPGDATDGEVLATGYVAALCGLHTTPACAEDRPRSCHDGLVLDDAAACESLMLGTLRACPGATETLLAHPDEVQACIAHLGAVTCSTDTPACDADGTPLDATGPCADVSARLRSACEDLPDPE